MQGAQELQIKEQGLGTNWGKIVIDQNVTTNEQGPRAHEQKIYYDYFRHSELSG